MQRRAQGILSDKHTKLNPYGETVPAFTFRVAMCHRGTDGGPPHIKRSPDGNHARYAGLQTCGSVWHCPICAPKVAAERRDEMNEAIAAWVKEGGEVWFETRTMQHTAETFGAGKLTDELAALSKALSRSKATRAACAVNQAAGVKGTIRALEPTYGEMNGWHAHTHTLIFAAPGQRLTLLRLRKLWARELIKRGLAGLRPGDIGLERFKRLRALMRRCYTLQDGRYAAEYVAKFGKEPENERGQWGLASELTRAHMKRGHGAREGTPQRCDHASPWALLNDALDGDERSAKLFREFAVSFQGKRQLFWSKGLKEYFFGTVGRSDEEIAASDDSRCTEHVIELTPGTWARVIAHDARFDLLRIAAREGRPGVDRFLAELAQAPPSHSPEFTEGKMFFIPWRDAA